jgi:LPXTG-site transpeptidase (sortase) family protein
MNSYPQRETVVLSTRKSLLLAASYFFLTLGMFGLGYAGYVYLDARHYQAVQMKKFENPAPRSTTSTPSSAPRALAKGEILGELQVPRLRMNTIVAQGDSHATLRRAVGHLADSALPGEWGNVALVGHRDTFFRALLDIRLGDEIRFNTRERSFEYRVHSIEIVGPRDVGVLKSSTGHDLTLLTCYPIYYVGPAPKRLIVRAREVEPREQSASQNTGNAGPL